MSVGLSCWSDPLEKCDSRVFDCLDLMDSELEGRPGRRLSVDVEGFIVVLQFCKRTRRSHYLVVRGVAVFESSRLVSGI